MLLRKGANNSASMLMCVSVLTRDQGVWGVLLVSCVDVQSLNRFAWSFCVGGVEFVK